MRNTNGIPLTSGTNPSLPTRNMNYIVQDENGKIIEKSPELRIEDLIAIFPKQKEKMQNILFNFDGVRYRYTVMKNIFASHEKWAERIHISEEGTTEADNKLIEQLKKRSIETGQTQKYRIENDFGWVENALDHELISIITNIKTTVDNIIDLWLCLNGFDARENRHWSLNDYLNPGSYLKTFVKNDKYFSFINNENKLWINLLNEKRDKAIHRIAEKNSVRLMPIKIWEIDQEKVTTKTDVLYRAESLDNHLDIAEDYFKKTMNFLKLYLGSLEKFAAEAKNQK